MTRGLLAGVFVTSATKLKAAADRPDPDSTSVRPAARGYAPCWEMTTLGLRVRPRVPELAVLDPATGEPIGYVPAGAAPEAHDAVRAARVAQAAWASTAPEARG